MAKSDWITLYVLAGLLSLFFLSVLAAAIFISYRLKNRYYHISRGQISLFPLSGSQDQLCLDEAQLEEWNIPPTLLETKRGQELSRALQQQFDLLVEEGFRDRMEAEACVTKGDRVWLSHFTSNGQLKHWVLITHGHKYELRRKRPRMSEQNDTRMEETQSWVSIKSVLWSSLNGYEYSIKAGTVDEERRRLAISNIHQPIVDGFYFTMIGWTTKTKEEVDQVCNSTMESFGGYNLMLNNCQHFLRDFAKDVVTEKGPDWAWFVESTLSSYKYKPITNALALAILTRFWQEKLRETVEIVGDGQSVLVELMISECGQHIKTHKSVFVCALANAMMLNGDFGTGGGYGGNDPTDDGNIGYAGDVGGAGCSHSAAGDGGGGDGGGDGGA